MYSMHRLALVMRYRLHAGIMSHLTASGTHNLAV